MKPVRHASGWVCLALLPALAVSAASAAAGRERILFKDIPPADPAREVVQTVLDSKLYSMRERFSAATWKDLDYGGAWERAKRYFPASTYLVRPGFYFMTHGFDADGRLFMEIHESAYLTLCVENRRTFTPGTIVEEYGRMLASADGREASAFREKLGRLEPFVRDGTANRVLRKELGRNAYLGLLEGLRTEDYHMIAGGLMHEGMHASLDDALVARLQAEFGAGERAVQWDELRAFMAEIGYHSPFCAWAAEDISGDWRRIEVRLGELEGLRKSRDLPSGPGQARFETARTGAWAEAAFVRLRMREIWQSARRMRDLAASFRKDDIKGAPPADFGDMLAKLDGETAGFAASAGKAIQATETAVRSLEEALDTWGEWAAGRRPFPPPVTDSQAIFRQVKDIRWPDPAPMAAATAALMNRAVQELSKEKASLSGGLRPPISSPRPDSAPASSAGRTT